MMGPLAGALSLDDAHLELRLPALPIDEARVVAIARDLSGLAQQLADARARLAPPTSVTVDRLAWSALASELGSVTRWGNLGIVGTRFGRHVTVGLAWDDAGPHVEVRVAGSDPAPTSTIMAGRAFAASDLPSAVQAMVAAWPPDFAQLDLRPGDANARLRLADAPRPLVRAERVRELVVALAALLDALGPAAGPYR